MSRSSTSFGSVSSPVLHQGLTNGFTYYYVVTALNAAGESAESAVAMAVPVATSGNQPPTLLVRRPDDSTNGVFADAGVFVRFDKDLNGTTLTPANLQLRQGGTDVAFNVSSAGPSFTLTPVAPLAFESTYQATVTTGLRDTTGLGPVAPFTWTFTTGSAPPTLEVIRGSSSATLRWTPVPGATSYVLTRTPAASFAVTGVTFTEPLTNGTTYRYRVAAVTAFGVSMPSNEVTVLPSVAAPARPGLVRVVAARSTALVSWPEVATATGYTLYRAATPTSPFIALDAGLATTTYLDTGLTPGTTPAYLVQVESLAGPSPYSVERTAPTDPALLPAPASVTASGGARWVQVTWSPVAGASGYVIWRAQVPNGDPARIGWVTTGTRYEDLSVTNGETYRYFVGAVSSGPIGDLLEAGASPLPTLVPPPPFVARRPSVAVGLVSIAAGERVFTGATLRLFRSTSPDAGFVQITSNPDTGLTGGTTYYYAARSELGGNLSDFSNVVSATPTAAAAPPVPTGLTATGYVSGANVSWSPSSNANGYEVRYSTVPGGPYTLFGCNTSEPFETFCSLALTNGVPAYVAVRATNGTTPSAFSPEVVVTAANMGPTAGLASPSVGVSGGNGRFNVGWNFVPSAALYRVFRRTDRSPWTLLGTTTTLGWNDDTVVNDTDYRYAIQAVNLGGGNTRYSPTAVSAYVTPSAALPLPPTGLSVLVHNSRITARWAPVPGARAYDVLISVAEGGAAGSATNSCSTNEPFVTSCQLSVTNGTPYFLAVRASTHAGFSAYSDEVAVTPASMGPPDPSFAVFTGNGTIALTWVATSQPGDSFRLFRRTRDSAPVSLSPGSVPSLFDPVTNGVEYEYTVSLIRSGLEGPTASTGWLLPVTALPVGPTITEAVAGRGEVTLGWTPVQGVNGYTVYTAPTPSGPFGFARSITGSAETRVTVSLANGVERWVAVVAEASSGGSVISTPVAVTPALSNLASPNITVTEGFEAVQLSWPAVSGATSYRVFRRLGEAPWQTLSTQTAVRLSDFDVENGERVFYAVQARSASVASAWGMTTVVQPRASLPRTPTVLSVQPGQSALQVEWTPVSGATGYSVFVASAFDGPYNFVGQTTSEFESRFRASATNGVPQFLVVRAIGPGGTGAASPFVQGTASANLPNPPGVTLAAQGPGSIRVSWAPISGAIRYRVYRRAPTTAALLVQTPTASPFTDTGLASGTSYTYYVEAENSVGRGAWSSPDTLAAP